MNRYLGFSDGNPANLNPLPLEPEAGKYVDYMGGADTILANARSDYDQGNYRFVATVVNKLVLADTNEQFALTLANGNLSYLTVDSLDEADVTLTLNRRDLMRLIGRQLSISELVSLGVDSIAGSPLDLASFLSVIEKDNRYYDMVPMPTE